MSALGPEPGVCACQAHALRLHPSASVADILMVGLFGAAEMPTARGGRLVPWPQNWLPAHSHASSTGTSESRRGLNTVLAVSPGDSA